jgi:hypothetical protein
MKLEEIHRAALGLYKDPSPEFVRAVLKDALRELSPPRSWAQWLVESGTLARLAECMVIDLGGPEAGSWAGHTEWRKELGISDELASYREISAAFGVPEILVAVRESSASFQQYLWAPPQATLALAVLRESIASPELVELLRSAPRTCLTSPPWPAWPDREITDNPLPVDRHVRACHPAIWAYRLKLGDGPWVERRLLARP